MCAPIAAFAQSGDTVFTVKKPAASISVSPAAEVLYKNVSKKFILHRPDGLKIDSIVFSKGTILRKDSAFAVKALKTGTGLLKIYTKDANGKSELVFVKEFAVRTFAEPKPNLDGVESDSAIYQLKVIAQGYVNVPVNTDEALKGISHKVLSFEMQEADKGKMDTLKAGGNRLTYEMRDRIDHMQDGNTIEISNIKYLMDGDTFIIRKPLRVYLLTGKATKF